MTMPARMTRLLTLAVAVPLGFAGCSAANDDASDTTSDRSQSTADGQVTDDGGGAGDTRQDDIVGDLLRLFGLSSEILTREERDCMNRELAETYPDGVPEGAALDEATFDKLDEAGVSCAVKL